MLQLFCDVESEENVPTTEGQIKSLGNQKINFAGHDAWPMFTED
jgi:hypothetical protein